MVGPALGIVKCKLYLGDRHISEHVSGCFMVYEVMEPGSGDAMQYDVGSY
jgi:hypothetical protein